MALVSTIVLRGGGSRCRHGRKIRAGLTLGLLALSACVAEVSPPEMSETKSSQVAVTILSWRIYHEKEEIVAGYGGAFTMKRAPQNSVWHFSGKSKFNPANPYIKIAGAQRRGGFSWTFERSNVSRGILSKIQGGEQFTLRTTKLAHLAIASDHDVAQGQGEISGPMTVTRRKTASNDWSYSLSIPYRLKLHGQSYVLQADYLLNIERNSHPLQFEGEQLGPGGAAGIGGNVSSQ